MKAHRTFVNEIHNQIEVEVILAPRRDFDRLRLTMTGPWSKSDNFVTRREAEMLRDALVEVLS